MLNLRLVNLNLFLVFLIKSIGSGAGVVNHGVAGVVAGVVIQIESAAGQVLIFLDFLFRSKFANLWGLLGLQRINIITSHGGFISFTDLLISTRRKIQLRYFWWWWFDHWLFALLKCLILTFWFSIIIFAISSGGSCFIAIPCRCRSLMHILHTPLPFDTHLGAVGDGARCFVHLTLIRVVVAHAWWRLYGHQSLLNSLLGLRHGRIVVRNVEVGRHPFNTRWIVGCVLRLHELVCRGERWLVLLIRRWRILSGHCFF